MDFLDRLKNASSKDQHLDWANLSYYWRDNEKLIESSGEKTKLFSWVIRLQKNGEGFLQNFFNL